MPVKKLFVVLLALALALPWAALSEGEAPEQAGDGQYDLSETEVLDFEVPERLKPEATDAPKIEVPEIPEIELPEIDLPWMSGEGSASPGAEGDADSGAEMALTDDAGEADPDAAVPGPEALLNALGRDAFRETYEALLEGEVLKRGSKGDAARGLQQTLVAFGRDIAVDDNVGPKTMAALNEVQKAFNLEKTSSLDDDGYAALLPGLLAAVHPEEAEALLGERLGGEYQYIRGCALELQGKCFSARQAFEASGWSDWEARAAACEQKRPRSGLLYEAPNVRGSDARVTARLEGEGESALLVKIYDEEDTLARMLFVGSNGKASASLPEGNYAVKVGLGEAWYSEAEAFGPEGDYRAIEFNGGKRRVELEKNSTLNILVNGQETSVDGETVETEDEEWENF